MPLFLLCSQRAVGVRGRANKSTQSGWSTDRVGEGVVWGVTFPSPVPVSSVKLYWDGQAPRSYTVEVTNDPLPDLKAAVCAAMPAVPAGLSAVHAPPTGDGAVNPDESYDVPITFGVSATPQQQEDPALRNLVLLTSSTVAAVASSLQAVICGTPPDDAGTGSASTSTVSPLAASSAASPPQQSTPVTVTWRVVHQAAVADSEAILAEDATGNEDPAARPHSQAPVGGASSSVSECSRITGLRIFLKNTHRFNSRNAVGLAAVHLMTPQATAGGTHVPPLSVVRNLQVRFAAFERCFGLTLCFVYMCSHYYSAWNEIIFMLLFCICLCCQTWLREVANNEPPSAELSSTAQRALTVSLQAAMASASQEALLRYCNDLLVRPLSGVKADTALYQWETQVGFDHASAVESALGVLSAGHVEALSRFVKTVAARSPGSSQDTSTDLVFDPTDSSDSTILEFSKGFKHGTRIICVPFFASKMLDSSTLPFYSP